MIILSIFVRVYTVIGYRILVCDWLIDSRSCRKDGCRVREGLSPVSPGGTVCFMNK